MLLSCQSRTFMDTVRLPLAIGSATVVAYYWYLLEAGVIQR